MWKVEYMGQVKGTLLERMRLPEQLTNVETGKGKKNGGDGGDVTSGVPQGLGLEHAVVSFVLVAW